MKKRFYLIGANISQSYSPQIHSIIYNESGLNAEYFLHEITGDALSLPENFDGLNITQPFKSSILRVLDKDFSGCGSVNTVVKSNLENNKKYDLYGYSTDGEGFLLDAERLGLDLSDTLIIGTGGAARSIAFALKKQAQTDESSSKNSISVFSRDIKKAENFANEFKISAHREGRRYTLAINCTPVAFAVDFFRAKEYYDLKYNGGQGLGMLIYQAILADNLFFDTKIDLEIFGLIHKKITALG